MSHYHHSKDPLEDSLRRLREENENLRRKKSQIEEEYGHLEKENSHMEEETERLKEEVNRLKRQQDRLEQEIERLRRELEAAHRAGKRQAAPFSRGEPKADPRQPGRRPGVNYGTRAYRPIPEHIDQRVDVPLPDSCPHCGGSINEMDVASQYQTDIPQPRPYITEFRIHIGKCRRCGRRIQPRHPAQTSDAIGAAASQVGPRAVALGVQMNKALGLPYEKVVAILKIGFKLPVSRGGLCQAIARTADKADITYQSLIVAIRQSPRVTADETGWKVAAQLHWLWVFVSETVTVYAIAGGRGYLQAESVLGATFEGSLVRDGWAPYRKFELAIHQSCVGHLTNRCKEMLQLNTGMAARLPHNILEIFHDALALRDRQRSNDISPHGALVAIGKIEARTDRLLLGHYTNPANIRMVKHLGKERPHLFTFLYDPNLDATNWRAEQAIRPAVVTRKVWGGNRTESGAKTQQILTSVLRTCHQQHLPAQDLLVNLLCSKEPFILPLAPSGSDPPV